MRVDLEACVMKSENKALLIGQRLLFLYLLNGREQIERCLRCKTFCSLIAALILFKHRALTPSFRCSQYEQKIDEFRGVLRKKIVHMG